MRVLIYTDVITTRLSYTFDFIMGDLLGLQYDFTSTTESFINYAGPKFSYAKRAVEDEFFLECVTLLFEEDIKLQPIDFIKLEDMIGFYPVSKASAMPFDMFASTFVMISRYNEYLLHKKDKYDRYRASQSTNYIGGFLGKPMINYYALHLKKLLVAKFPALLFKKNKFEYTATVDVDMAYAYRGHGANANFKGFAKSMLMSDFADVKQRWRVLFRNKKDPYDTFDEILETCENYGVKTKFFFLVGNQSSLDQNVVHTYEPFKKLIKDVAKQSDIGIHLSFMSHISNEAMEEEIKRLEYISEEKITSNRFHFLRFTLPASYISLSKIGITEDYSFGYATRIGFRAATCTPFYFFNLFKNERTNIKIYPFAFMDTTLAQYNKIGSRESLAKILQIMKWVKEVEGPFIGAWHNSSFAETGIWKGWKEVFETVAKEAAALTEHSE